MKPTVLMKASPPRPRMYGHGQCLLSPLCFTAYPLHAFLCLHFKLLLLLPFLFLLLTTGLLLVPQAETQNHPLVSSLAHSHPTSKYPQSPVSYPQPCLKPIPLFPYHYSSGSQLQLFLHRAKRSPSNWFAGLQHRPPPTLL